MPRSSRNPQAGQPDAPGKPKKDKAQPPALEEAATAAQLRWHSAGTTDIIPSTVQTPSHVLLLFHGLFCFCYHKNKFCEVGVHTAAPRHQQFVIRAYELLQGLPHPLPNPLPPPFYSLNIGDPKKVPGKLVEVEIANRPRNDVSFYLTSKTDPRDWAFLPDLEGPDFYHPEKLKKKKALELRLRIKHGVFFTHCQTRSKFRRVRDPIRGVPSNSTADPEKKDLDHIAYVNGCLISHEADEYVSIKIGPTELKLQQDAGQKKVYVVYFGHDCRPSEGIDFHLYYKAFHVPDKRKKYKLKLKEDAGPQNACVLGLSDLGISGFAPRAILDLLNQNIRSSDNTPCGAAGFGRSDNLDP